MRFVPCSAYPKAPGPSSSILPSQQNAHAGEQRDSHSFSTTSRENQRSVFRSTILQLLSQGSITDREEVLPMPYAGQPCAVLRRSLPGRGLERAQTHVPLEGLETEAARAADRSCCYCHGGKFTGMFLRQDCPRQGSFLARRMPQPGMAHS